MIRPVTEYVREGGHMTVEKKRPVNLSLSTEERKELEELAKANRLSISALVRFLSAKALDAPEEFGLISPNLRTLAATHR
jgi:hypothetical protein